MRPLSERLETAADCQGEIRYDVMDSLLREAAAIVRAVEGAARITAEGREFRLVPLDAAGSAEGRG